MSSLETDDEFTIVNRSTEFKVSKRLLCGIPYFEKMFSHDLIESKNNRVELDFDEQALKLIVNWIEFGVTFIEMNTVINLCTIADYFGINNPLVDDCINHFNDNFTIEVIPVILPQVTATSKLINTGTIDVFIRRYFTKIASSTVWSSYPIETIAYICKLDLMIYSEMQVFDAIMKWVNSKADTRKPHLKELLKLVRWGHLKEKDALKIKENELVKTSGFEELYSQDGSDCNCIVDRTKQGFYVVIGELNDKKLRVEVFDYNFLPVINQVLQSDESMSLHLPHDEHVSDVFDSGNTMIRIDWKQMRYRLLDNKTFKEYYRKVYKCIFENQESQEFSVNPESEYYSSTGTLFREADEKFILIKYENKRFKWWTTPNTNIINSHLYKPANSFLATVLGNNIYILRGDLEFFSINFERKLVLQDIEFHKFNEFHFHDFVITSSRVNGDRVILVNKSSKSVFYYDVETQKWISLGRISSRFGRSVDGTTRSEKLITFTSTFLSMDSIKLCMNLN